MANLVSTLPTTSTFSPSRLTGESTLQTHAKLPWQCSTITRRVSWLWTWDIRIWNLVWVANIKLLLMPKSDYSHSHAAEKFAGFATSTNSSGTPILTLNRFDGAPLQPMFLISRTPIMLNTSILSSGIPSSYTVSPTANSAAGRSRAEWGMILGICIGAVVVVAAIWYQNLQLYL